MAFSGSRSHARELEKFPRRKWFQARRWKTFCKEVKVLGKEVARINSQLEEVTKMTEEIGRTLTEVRVNLEILLQLQFPRQRGFETTVP